MTAPIRLATRASRLALAQTETVAAALDAVGIAAELVPVERADAVAPPPGDKARFVRTVEAAVLEGRADIGVHSAKDLPGELPTELIIAGVPPRLDPADIWIGAVEADAGASTIGEGPGSLAAIPHGARVGTASLRRRAELLAVRPDLRIEELRGNVDTRMGRLAAGDFDGIILASAGLIRLGREAEISFRFSPDEMVPAAGQGALVLQTRRDHRVARAAAMAITDSIGITELIAERATIQRLEADCDTPVGVLARVSEGQINLRGFVGRPDGSDWIVDELTGSADAPVSLGDQLADRMLAAGAESIMGRDQSDD